MGRESIHTEYCVSDEFRLLKEFHGSVCQADVYVFLDMASPLTDVSRSLQAGRTRPVRAVPVRVFCGQFCLASLPPFTWLVDTYHFCSSKKKDNVLVKSFGPRIWQIIATDMRAAVYAKTEEECLEHIRAAIEKVQSSQPAIDKIVYWQERRNNWALYKRNRVKGHQNTEGPYVEQNHASLVAIAGDDKRRTLEDNIVDVISRTKLILQKHQDFDYKWQAEAQLDLQRMDASRRGDLEQARLRLCKNQYEFFVTEYDSRYSYNCNDEIVGGHEGTRVRHSSNSNEGYFIPDAGINGVGRFVHVRQNKVMHVVAVTFVPSECTEKSLCSA
eukprot:scaffold29448_cov65-Skeletonema_marinoi.AAC.2